MLCKQTQQGFMRHADIRTTMNVYGKAMEIKRKAFGKSCGLVLPSELA
jgi:hypothetical protein